MIKFLDWDSNFFGKRIGSVHLYSPEVKELKELIKDKKENNFQLIYLFIEKPSTEIHNWIVNHSGLLVDNKVNFEKIIHSNKFNTYPNIIEFNEFSNSKLKKLAISSGHKSRFKVDPRLNSKYEELFIIWIERSIEGVMADKVFVYIDNDEIVGFVSIKIKEDYGQIGLIAVDDEHQKKGIGIKLIETCEAWLHNNQIFRLQVITQKENTGACLLYKKTCFAIIETQTIYHI